MIRAVGDVVIAVVGHSGSRKHLRTVAVVAKAAAAAAAVAADGPSI